MEGVTITVRVELDGVWIEFTLDEQAMRSAGDMWSDVGRLFAANADKAHRCLVDRKDYDGKLVKLGEEP